MGALRAHIPGKGVTAPIGVRTPLTRIAQARSDLSPPGRGDAGCEGTSQIKLIAFCYFAIAAAAFSTTGLGVA